ncbi:MAG: hypothetical protein A3B78_02940 [Omnitrophica WOR_2 bacterium RIFCSPHIGHO2_02_FULL_67_20]|nr:MAG: hypothetical protein A3B78_02940 [Omnitrophica WOR_2 bacterium RIFCSPHIGHO2_02_FULL_67_20]
MGGALVVLLSMGRPALAQAREAAVIVNPANPNDSMSFQELVKIFKQEKQTWEDGKKIYLLVQEAGSVERDVVLKTIYRMNNDGLKSLWLGKLFREEIAAFPHTVASNEGMKRFVSQVPTAIGFIDAAMLDATVKALRIDGKLPGEPGYPLKDPE